MSFTFNPFIGNLDSTLTYTEIEALGFVPYTGATANVDLGNHTLTCGGTTSGMSTIEQGLAVNESGGSSADCDFRVETNTVSNALFIDASEDQVNFNTTVVVNSGNVGIGTNPTCKFEVLGDVVIGDTDYNEKNQVTVFRESDGDENAKAIDATCEFNSDSNSTKGVNALNCFATTNASASGNLTQVLYGGGLRNRYLIQHSGTGTVTKASAVTTQVGTYSTGDIAYAVCYNAESPVINTGSTTTAFVNYFVEGGSVDGTITTHYGLLINDLDSGATRYAIYTGEDQVYFGGNLTVNGTTSLGLSAGVDNSVVVQDSDGTLKVDEIDSRVWGTSLVDYSGTPADNQIAVFTDANTIEGDSDFTWTGSRFTINNGAVLFSGTTGATPASGAGVRFMWIPEYAAFRAGEVSGVLWDEAYIGRRSFAAGYNTLADGDSSFAVGDITDAEGDFSAAFGYNTYTSGNYSVGFGKQGTASGGGSTVFGFNCDATNFYALAGGSGSEASGGYSFVWGSGTAEDNYAVSMGNGCAAEENYTFAGGINTTAANENDFAFGSLCTADSYAGFAVGYDASATGGLYAIAMGFRAKSRQGGFFAHNSYRIRENDDCNSREAIFTLEVGSEGDGVLIVASNTELEIPEDFVCAVTCTFCIKADDGKAAMAKRMCLIKNIGGTTSMVGTAQTIGTDIDPDGLIDDIDFAADDTNDELTITFTNAHTDDVGVVCKVEVLENGYTAAAGT